MQSVQNAISVLNGRSNHGLSLALAMTGLCWIWLTIPCGAAEAAKSPVLVKDGKPAATIVTAAKPRQGALLAMAEFQYYLKKMTGTQLPVVADVQALPTGVRVFIGDSAPARALGFNPEKLEPESYCVRTGEDYLLIAGRDQEVYGEITYEKDGSYPGFQWWHELGTFWGVLDFLETGCGVRWYLPGAIGEIVPPPTNTFAAPVIERQRRPWALHRWVVPRPFPKRLYWYFGMPSLTPADLAEPRDVNLWWLHLRVHNEPVSFSHNAYEFYNKYWKSHPEYFAQGYTDKRVEDIQPAFHKPEVVRAYADMANAFFDKPRDERFKQSNYGYNPDWYAVSPMDNGNFCRSPEAKAYFTGEPPAAFWGGYTSRYIWDFVNGVARQVGAKHPDKWIGCFAYWQYYMPYEGLKLEPNVAVQFCRDLTSHFSPTRKANDEKALDAWVKIKPARLYLYEYFCFPQLNRHDQFPGIFPRWIDKDLKHMKAIGLRGAYNDISNAGVGGNQQWNGAWCPYAWANPVMDSINFYVWFKYLDDQSRDVNTILDEMYTQLYGPAGRHVRKFVELASDLYADWSNYKRPSSDESGLDGKTSWELLCPPKRLKQFGDIMAEAHAAARTPIEKERVKIFDEGMYQMMKKSSETWVRQNPVLTPENSQALPDLWRCMPDPEQRGRTNGWFAADFDDHAWREVSTSKFLEDQGIKDYIHAWYRVAVNIPATCKGKTVTLRLGAVDETYWVWVNGKLAGQYAYDPILDASSWTKPQFLDITAIAQSGSINQITVLVQNKAGAGGIWKPSQLIFN